MDIKPILLFGMPRSGTTWLGKVFDSHPETLYRHEPDSGGVLDEAIPLLPSVEQAGAYRQAIRQFVDTLPSDRSLRVIGKLPVFTKRYQPKWAFPLRRMSLVAAKGLSRWVTVSQVPEFVRHAYSGNGYLVWKSIESLGRLGVIARALPEARAIHIIRHPCGYVSSVLRGEAKGLLPGTVSTSEDYGILKFLLNTEPARRRGLSVEFFESLHPVQRLAWRWLLFNEKAIDDLQGMKNAMSVCYEDLCCDPMGGYRSLFEFTGLEWQKQTEQFLNASTENEKSAYFSVFKDPMQASSGWRQQLSSEDQERVLAVVSGTAPSDMFGI